MEYRYCPNEPSRFATNLRRDHGKPNLMWDNARGQDVLLVQTPFQQSATDIIEKLCEAMSGISIHVEKYTEVLPGVWVRFVTAADKAKLGGCPIHNEASTYTVFSCATEGNVCCIFAPQYQAMISAHCDIPMQIHVTVSEQTRTEGIFKKRLVSTGYYILSFPAGISNGCKDGDLAYKVRNITIPVTRQMLEQRTVYIKTDSRPEIISKNKGLKLI